jgi:hypothetical protein
MAWRGRFHCNDGKVTLGGKAERAAPDAEAAHLAM